MPVLDLAAAQNLPEASPPEAEFQHTPRTPQDQATPQQTPKVLGVIFTPSVHESPRTMMSPRSRDLDAAEPPDWDAVRSRARPSPLDSIEDMPQSPEQGGQSVISKNVEKDTKSSKIAAFFGHLHHHQHQHKHHHHHHGEEEGQQDNLDGMAMLGIRLQHEEVQDVMNTWAADQKANLWMRFDLTFGGFVILNAIILGIQTDDSTKANPDDRVLSDDANIWLERVFLCIFSFEFLCRVGWLKFALLKDGWMYLDLFLIFNSAMDVFNLTAILMSGVENPGMFSILRAFRLVRLFRVIRLVRLMKELWLLVQGMMRAMRILIWAVMLLMVAIYIIAIMMTETIGKKAEFVEEANDLPAGSISYLWGRLPFSMLSLSQVVTMDDWSGMLQPFWANDPLIFMLLFLFLIICGLGIMNLVVGVMCQTSIEVSENDDKVNRYLAFVKEYRALMSLRSLLIARYAMKKGTSLVRSEILICLEDTHDTRCFDLLQTAGLSLHEVCEILDVMNIFGNRKVEIDRLIEALVWFRGEVKDRALDIFLCNMQARKLTQAVQTMGIQAVRNVQTMRTALASIQNAPEVDDDAAPKGKTHNAKDDERHAHRYMEKSVREARGDPSQQHTDTVGASAMNKKDRDALDETMTQNKVAKAMAKFDSISACLVLSNAAMIGMSIDDVGGGSIDYVFIEQIYCFIFIFELCLRILLWVQLNLDGDFRLCCFCCPHDQLGHWSHTFFLIKQAMPILMKDTFFVCDLVVITMSVIDAVIYWSSSKPTPLNGFVLLRIMRLARTARVFRLVRLLKELWLMVSSLIAASKTLFWSVGLLGVCVYVGSILMTDSFKDEEWAKEEWGQVGTSMWSLLHCVSYDDWAGRVRRVGDHSFVYFIVIMAFTIVCALGIMNLVVGLMCDTALTVVAATKLAQFKLEMLELQYSVHAFEVAAAGSVVGASKYLTHHRLHHILKDNTLLRKFHDHGHMGPEQVWDIFKKLDVTNQGQVLMDLFIEGILRSREPLNNEELIVTSLMMGSLKNEALRMQKTFALLSPEVAAACQQIMASKKVFDDAKANKSPIAWEAVGQTTVAEFFHTRATHQHLRKLVGKESDHLYQNSFLAGGTAGPQDM
eukprot:gnl/MRDRNA2_/MRDRNA2_80911_c0_seq1.p1 gnl/MRDRNA2_/MRDRNA2_80911_c0~~gnl/MRDRNA2_/MRDRNA2_80911_c0_seq1.p1  ORF type:complete len:1229 (+),score=198.14 gnl/MRDRNA2_/MRDRNA2_80911_c0_seq1:359-3688(+)